MGMLLGRGLYKRKLKGCFSITLTPAAVGSGCVWGVWVGVGVGVGVGVITPGLSLDVLPDGIDISTGSLAGLIRSRKPIRHRDYFK